MAGTSKEFEGRVPGGGYVDALMRRAGILDQGDAIVFDSRQASTLRLNQSMMATR